MVTLQLQRIGKALREMRTRRGLTQAAVARLAGVGRRKVIEVEQGAESVSVRAYAAVADALGADLSLVPSRHPTLEEVGELFAPDD